VNRIKWNNLTKECHPKAGKEILVAQVSQMSYHRAAFPEGAMWTPLPVPSECEHFYSEYSEIANVIECILGLPKDTSVGKKAEYFEIIRHNMEKAISNLKTE